MRAISNAKAMRWLILNVVDFYYGLGKRFERLQNFGVSFFFIHSFLDFWS